MKGKERKREPFFQLLIGKNLLPVWTLRLLIRGLARKRLHDEGALHPEIRSQKMHHLIDELLGSPLAVNVAQANEQHYEVPARFFELVLGTHLKYSSAYYSHLPSRHSSLRLHLSKLKLNLRRLFYRQKGTPLDEAEATMLQLSFERANLQDGQTILELGCGWGSFTIFLAERLPKSQIVAVSNSLSQKEHIEKRLKDKKLKNCRILVRDMNDLELDKKFDRIVSIEMFEHMRNYGLLFAKLRKWLKPTGKLFVHIFTHREIAYLFEPKDSTDWMAKYFFTGGIMPSNHLLLHFCSPLRIEKHWLMSGLHYHLTAESWIANLQQHKKPILSLLQQVYGKLAARSWFYFWRLFFLAVSETFAFRSGNEWMVNHYLFGFSSPKTKIETKTKTKTKQKQKQK